MLQKIGKGTTLEDLQKVKGGLVGSCGTNGCSVCGANNHERLHDSFEEWSRTDF